MTTHIKRDPFARETLMRKPAREIHNVRPDETCKECGGPARFAYKWERDSIGYDRTPYTGMFCSVGCYRAFTGDYR